MLDLQSVAEYYCCKSHFTLQFKFITTQVLEIHKNQLTEISCFLWHLNCGDIATNEL